MIQERSDGLRAVRLQWWSEGSCVCLHTEHLGFQLFQSKGLASQNSPGHPRLSINVRAADCQLTHRNFSGFLSWFGCFEIEAKCAFPELQSVLICSQPQVSGGEEVWGGVGWCGVGDEDRLWDTQFTRRHVQSRAPDWLAGPLVWWSLSRSYHSGSTLSHWACTNGSLGHQEFPWSWANEWFGLDASATGNSKTTVIVSIREYSWLSNF